MSSRRVLFENITSLAVLQGLYYITPLITLPYLVRTLQPSHFGLLSFAQGIVLYLDFLTDYGFNLSQTRAIAASRSDIDSVSRIFWSTICAKAILMSISAVVLVLSVGLIPKMRTTPEIYIANFLYVIGTTFFPIWLFQGLERIKLAAALSGTARLLTVPAVFLFVKGPQDYIVAAAIQASVEVVASLVAWPIIFSRIGITWYLPSLPEVVGTLKHAWPLFLSSSALQFCASGTVVILGFASGNVETGYFSAADKLIKAASAALNPIAQALYPHITAAKLRSHQSAFNLIKRTFFVVAILTTFVSLITAFCARPICDALLGKSFVGSIAILRWLSPLPALYGLMNVLGTQTMLVFDMDELFSRIVLFSSLAGVPLIIVLSRLFASVGAAVGSVATAAVTVACLYAALHSNGMLFWQRSGQSGACIQGAAKANQVCL
jgi:PST family polysaccharide transporter